MIIDELIENFEQFDAWEDRYRYVIDLGRHLAAFDPAYKTDAFKVEGCVSQVWLMSQPAEGNRLRFAADSDSAIVKGLAAVLLTIYSDHTPEEILATNLEGIFARIGLEEHLSPNRRNGFFLMVEAIKGTAKARIAARLKAPAGVLFTPGPPV
jgi:cysteine desulfuration protein SufE